MFILDSIRDFLRAIPDWLAANRTETLIIVLAVFAFVLWHSGFFHRLFRIVEEIFFTNWQLALLGTTGVVLSLASGYTTWDGLRNFSSAPWLSFAIAFGIQGVMLIVAWLIGESFAVGMNQRLPHSKPFGLRDATLGMLLGMALIGIAFYWVLNQSNAVSWTKTANLETDWVKLTDVTVYFIIGLILLALLAFNLKRGGEISVPYVQSVRVILKNVVLWVMFLASMSASVFFSFDSHFNAIFPKEARKRAAEIRSVNQVGGVVADIGALTQKRQIEEAEALFHSEGWKAYEKQLASLAQAAQGAQGEIERYFVQLMEDRSRAIAEQRERIAGAERSQSALLRKRDELESELQRIEAGIGALENELAKAQAVYGDTRQKIAAKRIEAAAEDGGVEGTLKRGKGPVYRERMAELADLQRKLTITDEPRLKEAQKLRDQASARLVSIKREIATINGEVAKYRGEVETAEERIKAAQQVGTEEKGRVDPARVLPAFERARAAFRQQPDVERLGMLHQQCTNLLNALMSTPATKEKVRSIDCDPKQAAEAAARVFALNAGLAAFQANCAGGDKLPQAATTDALLAFGRKCLQDSGLTSKDSAEIGARLSAIDMNRDDKAHNFVVTWNAFLDGNRLAYLALMLAIGVDALVFMSGLFGANALRSPLTDVPSNKARSAHQLEAIIEAALLPDTFKKASIAHRVIHPLEHVDASLRGAGDLEGFTHEVRLYELDPESAGHVLDVLNAGATIGAVRHADRPGRYLVRGELYEFLCEVLKRELKHRPAETRRLRDSNELETRIAEALWPHVGEGADSVLQYLLPIEEDKGFTSEIFLSRVEERHARAVRNVLTAGSSLFLVQRDRKDSDRYYLHAELYKTLARLRARSAAVAERALPLWGGRLTAHNAAIADGRSAAARERLGGNGHAGRESAPTNGSAYPSEQELRAQFEQGLLAALGLSRSALAKVSDPNIAVQALATAGTLRRHPRLQEYLRLSESNQHRILEAAQGILAAEHKHNKAALDLLEETATEIGKLIPALMLLPQSNVLDHLVEELEDGYAENRLRADEHGLLERLRRLKADLENMDWSDKGAWAGLARRVEQLDGSVPSSGNGHRRPYAAQSPAHEEEGEQRPQSRLGRLARLTREDSE
jgi:peptidoglycan hydrolase CwlO-like protein